MKKKSFAAFFAAFAMLFSFHAALFADDYGDYNSWRRGGWHGGYSQSDDMMYYRGMRMLSSRADFYVTQIEFEEDDDVKIKLEVKFNMQIDPRTVNVANILLNGTPIPQSSRLSFSKRGDKFEIEFPLALLSNYYASGGAFTLTLGDIKSFNNVALQESVFDDLYVDCEYEYHLYRRDDGVWFMWREEDW